jgi:hypothetical protein
MKIELSFAELHTALFLAGTNLGLKLNKTHTGLGQRQGLYLLYDRENKELLVYWNKSLAIVPSTNVASMTPVDPEVLGTYPVQDEVKPVKAITPRPNQTIKEVDATVNNTVKKSGKVNAQVSTPTSHVFMEGPGLTGQEPK